MTLFKKKEVPTPVKNIQEIRYQNNLLAPMIGFGAMIVLAVLVYGFFVAPCSLSFQGKIEGLAEMENPLIAGQAMRITSMEGSFSATAPCLAILSTGFNAKATNTPTQSTPVRVKPHSLSPVGGI